MISDKPAALKIAVGFFTGEKNLNDPSGASFDWSFSFQFSFLYAAIKLEFDFKQVQVLSRSQKTNSPVS